MTTESTGVATPHPALKVIDNEIAALTAAKCEHQREAANLDNRAILLGALRAKVEAALNIPAPQPSKPPVTRRPRRTKAEIAADKAKTIAAAVEGGLVRPSALPATAHESADALLTIPPELRRAQTAAE